MTANRRSL